MAVLFVIVLIFYIFFRQEVANLFKKIEKSHPFWMIFLILFLMSYLSWYNHNAILSFVDFIYYNVTKLQNTIAKMVRHLFPRSASIDIFNLIVRALIFGLLLYFPEHYQKKYTSLVYQAQVTAVRGVCYFLLLILVMVFAAANL
ncbi:MAG TPA: hypothetical protein DCZ80_00095 [Legionellales bacterium]|nr:hypothetical protein [Legionellales bacterium]